MTARRRPRGRAAIVGAPGGGAGPVAYALSCPATGIPGKAITCTLSPQGVVVNDTVTLASAGTLVPSGLAFFNSGAPQHFTVTYPTAGTITVAATSADGGAVFGSPATIVVAAPRRKPRWCPPRRRGR